MKIAITGGAGFIGAQLAQALLKQGHEVIILDLTESKLKDPRLVSLKINLENASVPEIMLGCNVIIHLAGVNIFGRWTPKYKELIISSRIKSAAAIINFLKDKSHNVHTFISASAIGYYGNTGENIADENYPAGNDFLAHVCLNWEQAALKAQEIGIRTVLIRTGIVLDTHGGMMAKLLPLFRLGLGGRLGNGEQWFSWVSLHDLINIYIEALTNTQLAGPVNAVSPNPVRNKEFTKILGTVLKKPTFLCVPRFALSYILGELSQVVLQSSRISSQKLAVHNFIFRDTTIEAALTNPTHLTKE